MEQQNSERHPRPRIESLADLIFGLSLSIGSIALIANAPANSVEINNHMLAFTFTFLMVITAWMIYTTQMSVLPVETRAIILLNVPLLLLVAIVPYLLNGVELVNPSLGPIDASALRNYSSTLFALDLSGILAILATFSHIISMEEKRLVAPELVKRFRSSRNQMAILAALMLISIAPQLWEWTLFGVPVRLYIWYVPLITYWVATAIGSDSRTQEMS
jgi:uncharacterized membrane protein